jgi:predicted Zn-dependent peptidase
MKQFNYPSIDETLYFEQLQNGLSVFILPKEKYKKFYVTLTTNFGSLNTKIKDKENYIDLPDGIAHFLEHKLFERQDMDISREFSMNQGNVNAYTQHNRTTYLFSATDNVLKNIGLLLKLVFTPEFSEEGINKEKDIITQEIKMYQDDPNAQIYNGILDNLFMNHPVKKEILGTIDSIKEINKEILQMTHETYYHPSNMVLFVTGNVNPEHTLNYVKKHMPKVKETTYQKVEVEIAKQMVHKKEANSDFEIKIPNYILGVKLEPCKDMNLLLKKEITLSVLMDLVLGKSTKNYQYLLEHNLINDSFGMDISVEESFGYFLIGSETNNPERLDKELRKILLTMDKSIITEELFIRTKKQTIGGFIQALNSLEYIANNFTKYHYQNTSLFELLDVSKSVTIEDIIQSMALFKNEVLYTKYTVYPKKR